MVKYLVVRCPNCNNLLIYIPREGRNKSKKCPYCGTNFKVLPKNKPSWERIIAVFDNYQKALNYIKTHRNCYNEQKTKI